MMIMAVPLTMHAVRSDTPVVWPVISFTPFLYVSGERVHVKKNFALMNKEDKCKIEKYANNANQPGKTKLSIRQVPEDLKIRTKYFSPRGKKMIYHRIKNKPRKKMVLIFIGHLNNNRDSMFT